MVAHQILFSTRLGLALCFFARIVFRAKSLTRHHRTLLSERQKSKKNQSRKLSCLFPDIACASLALSSHQSAADAGSGHSESVCVDKKNAFLPICAFFAQRGRVTPLATPRRTPRPHPSPSLVDKRSQQKKSDLDITNENNDYENVEN